MVYPVKCLSDNYAHVIQSPDGRVSAVVDPSEARPVVEFLKQKQLNLDYILLTHHHWDHIGGVPELKQHFNAQVIANHKDPRISGVDIGVSENELIRLGTLSALVYEIPGHTLGHVAYYFASEKALFSGDTLFALGCGRLFEGTPEQMFQSIQKLSNLPDDTQLFCGHEYTLNHCRFVEELSPNDDALKNYCHLQRKRMKDTGCTVPSLLGDEKRFNPFVRAETADAFAKIRKRKDDWN